MHRSSTTSTISIIEARTAIIDTHATKGTPDSDSAGTQVMVVSDVTYKIDTYN